MQPVPKITDKQLNAKREREKWIKIGKWKKTKGKTNIKGKWYLGEQFGCAISIQGAHRTQ
jgi:hypothetical protein